MPKSFEEQENYNFHLSAFESYAQSLLSSTGEQCLELLLDSVTTYVTKSYLLDENFSVELLENYHNLLIEYLSSDTISKEREIIISFILEKVTNFRFNNTKDANGVVLNALYLSSYRALRLIILLYKKLTLEQSKKLLAIVVDYITHIYIEAYLDYRYEQYKNGIFEFLLNLSKFDPPKVFHDKVLAIINSILPKVDINILKMLGFFVELNFPEEVFLLAQKHYPGQQIGLQAPEINTELAFEIYSRIPSWADEYGPAQFWMAILVCYHSNFTPEKFSEENVIDKHERLLEMKKYIDRAAETGFLDAVYEKERLDTELSSRETRSYGNVSITAHPAFFANKPKFKKASHDLILPIQIKFK